MSLYLSLIALVVDDYDRAIAYYTEILGFILKADEPREPEGKRWVVVSPSPSSDACSFLLARAVNEQQASRIGNQTGGRVFLFLHSDNFWRDYELFRSRGVNFVEAPRTEDYGTVVVFEDIYGNRWDLMQLHA